MTLEEAYAQYLALHKKADEALAESNRNQLLRKHLVAEAEELWAAALDKASRELPAVECPPAKCEGLAAE